MKKLFKTIITSVVGVAFSFTTSGLLIGVSCSNSSVIDILYTNDIHTTLENETTHINWANLKSYRDSLEAQGHKTLLVDAGDFVSGGIYGTLSNGSYPVELMKCCDYDLVVPGNHEFDYGMERFNELIETLDCEVVSSNFYKLKEDGSLDQLVFKDTHIFEIDNRKIGFVGVSTPHTLTSSNPKTFQDEDGNTIYTFLQSNIDEYYQTIQYSIDYLKGSECDYVIALTHLGIDDSEQPDEFSSNALIKNTSGLDVVIDGHSHTTYPAVQKVDKENKPVWLTQTGTGFANVGHMSIKGKDVEFELLNSLPSDEDAQTRTKMDQIVFETQQILGEQLGSLNFDLTINIGDKRAIRSAETNLGDFVADAYAYAVASDENRKRGTLPITLTNGGGIRRSISKGEVTVGDIINVASFANTLCHIQITGKQLFDALEFSVRRAKKGNYDEAYEFGGFLQVSDGLVFKVDTTIESAVLEDEVGNWLGYKDGQTQRRVSNVVVNSSDLQLDQTYDICGSTFVLLDGGDGYKKIFEGAKVVPCDNIIDYNALKEYFLHCVNEGTLDTYQLTANRIVIAN